MNCVAKKASSSELIIMNELCTLKPTLINSDRRQQINNNSNLYEKLNLIQKVMACELGRLGYQLHYIRGEYANSIAILLCNEAVATIDRQGEIDLNSGIKIRQ